MGFASFLAAGGQAKPVLSTLLAAVGIAVLLIPTEQLSDEVAIPKVAVVLAVVLAVGLSGPPLAGVPSSITSIRPVLFGMLGIVVLLTLVLPDTMPFRRAIWAVSLAAIATVLIAAILQEWDSPRGTDIYHAHKAAGRALLAGENPYTDAFQILSGNPHHPPGTIIEGYPYPPIVLFTYGLVGGLTDPRLVSTIALLGLFCWLGWAAVSQGSSRDVILGALVVLAFTPLLSQVWFMAWTEPLTIVLFLGSALAWKRSWLWAGILLGLALASKQYLVFLAPLLVLHRDEEWRPRSVTAAATAGATLLAGLVPNPTAFVNATFGNLVDIGFRPDTQSLPGAAYAMGWELLVPTGVWLAVSLVAAVILSRTSTQAAHFLGKSGLVLAVPFLLGLAFPNYWFLVACLLAMSMVFAAGQPQAARQVKERV